MKYLLTLIVALFSLVSFAQNNVIIQQSKEDNSSANSVDPNEYYIDGISTRLDIGGVEVEFVKEDYPYYYLKFTNYHNCTVSVIFQVLVNDKKTSGRIILRANETKQSLNTYRVYMNRDCKMIVRKL